MREGGLTCSFTNASPCLAFACALPKLNPNHLVSFPTFVCLHSCPSPSPLPLSPTAGPIQCWGTSGKAAHCTPSRNQPSEEKTAHHCGETPNVTPLHPLFLQPMASQSIKNGVPHSTHLGLFILLSIGSSLKGGSSCSWHVLGVAFSSLSRLNVCFSEATPVTKASWSHSYFLLATSILNCAFLLHLLNAFTLSFFPFLKWKQYSNFVLCLLNPTHRSNSHL